MTTMICAWCGGEGASIECMHGVEEEVRLHNTCLNAWHEDLSKRLYHEVSHIFNVLRALRR